MTVLSPLCILKTSIMSCLCLLSSKVRSKCLKQHVLHVYYRRACCEHVLFLAASVSCLSQRTKSQKLLIAYRCNLIGICPMENARWLEVGDIWLRPLTWRAILISFLIQAIPFKWLYLATSFSVQNETYIFRICKSPSSFKVMDLISMPLSQTGGSAQVCDPLGHILITHMET